MWRTSDDAIIAYSNIILPVMRVPFNSRHNHAGLYVFKRNTTYHIQSDRIFIVLRLCVCVCVCGFAKQFLSHVCRVSEPGERGISGMSKRNSLKCTTGYIRVFRNPVAECLERFTVSRKFPNAEFLNTHLKRVVLFLRLHILEIPAVLIDSGDLHYI